jgi:hypothetical protein
MSSPRRSRMSSPRRSPFAVNDMSSPRRSRMGSPRRSPFAVHGMSSPRKYSKHLSSKHISKPKKKNHITNPFHCDACSNH